MVVRKIGGTTRWILRNRRNVPAALTLLECSVWCPRSLDHLIRPLKERRRDPKAEGLGGLEVYDELEVGGIFDGEVGGFGSLENAVDIRGSASRKILAVTTVRH